MKKASDYELVKTLLNTKCLPGLVQLLFPMVFLLFPLSNSFGQQITSHLLTDFVSLKPYEKWTAEIPETLDIVVNYRVYLALKVRLNSPNFRNGSAFAFRVYVDQVPITIDRLANKQDGFLVNSSQYCTWYLPNGTFYALYSRFNTKSPPHWGRNHDYLFDITDFIREGQNEQVVVENIFDSVPNTVLEIKDCKISVGPKVKRNPYPEHPIPYYLSSGFQWARKLAISRNKEDNIAFKITENTVSPVNIVNPLPLPDLHATGKMNDNMKIDISFPRWKDIPIQTIIGTPGYKWQKGNDFKTFLRLLDADSKAIWQTNTYRLKRTLTSDNQGIIIEDHVTNLTDTDLPFSILYQLDVGNLSDLKEFRLFGEKQHTFYINTIPSKGAACQTS